MVSKIQKEDRKAFVENITAFSKFVKINEDSKLILHCVNMV